MDQAGAEPEEPPQGWFVDPFAVHEERWISQGRPTALVRDGWAESRDPPPDLAMPSNLVRAPAALPLGHSSDDLLRGGDRPGRGGDAPSETLEDRFGFFGNPVEGMVGMSPALATSGEAGAPAVIPMDFGGPPPTPKRLLRLRWIALGGAVVWTALVAVQFFSATTRVTTSPGHTRTETVYASSHTGVLTFIGLLVVCVVVTGIGFAQRVRSGSEHWGIPGTVCAGLLGVLGVLSLATVGLSMLLLAFLLLVIARPVRAPRPIPGERVVPSPTPRKRRH